MHIFGFSYSYQILSSLSGLYVLVRVCCSMWDPQGTAVVNMSRPSPVPLCTYWQDQSSAHDHLLVIPEQSKSNSSAEINKYGLTSHLPMITNAMVEWLTTPTSYSGGPWLDSVPAGNCQYSILKLGHDRFLPYPFPFTSFTYHPIINAI
jgi:hypothetical protein